MTNDFTGFSFDNIHSSALNILRVSDGDRYTETIHPDFEDKRKGISGRDGEYYYGSNYSTKTIPIKVAFDSMTEKQFRIMTYLFSSKKLCPLIFDERPYKMYMAKINSPVEMEYVCFDEYGYMNEIAGQGIFDGSVTKQMEQGRETPVRRDIIRRATVGDKQRIYKGEATIEFICPNPYARAPFKELDLYKIVNVERGNILTTYATTDQWAEASGILSTEDYRSNYIDVPIWQENSIKFKTYNPGDLDSPFCLYIPFTSINGVKKIGRNTGTSSNIKLNGQFQISVDSQVLVINAITCKAENSNSGLTDTGIIINTENHLIEGVNFDGSTSSWQTTGNLYNEYIVRGDFPKILHRSPYTLITGFELMSSVLQVTCYISRENIGDVRLFYDYLYY